MLEVDWRLPSEKPSRYGSILVQNLDGLYFWATVDEDFDEWSETIIRWAYVNVGKRLWLKEVEGD